MKKILNWVLAAILVCGATAMTARSSSDDNPAQGGGQEYPQGLPAF